MDLERGGEERMGWDGMGGDRFQLIGRGLSAMREGRVVRSTSMGRRNVQFCEDAVAGRAGAAGDGEEEPDRLAVHPRDGWGG